MNGPPARTAPPLAPWWARILIGAAACGMLGVLLFGFGLPVDERVPHLVAYAFLAPAAAWLAADLKRWRPRLTLAAVTGAVYGLIALAGAASGGPFVFLLYIAPWAGFIRARVDLDRLGRREVVGAWGALIGAAFIFLAPAPHILEPLGLAFEESMGAIVGATLTASLVALDSPRVRKILGILDAGPPPR